MVADASTLCRVMTNVANDGWVTIPGPDGTTLHARAERRGSETVITDLYIHSDDGFNPISLRALSARRLTAEMALAAGPGNITGNDVPTLMAIVAAARDITDPAPEPTLAELRARIPRTEQPSTREPLTRPTGTDRDSFQRRVAAAYLEYAVQFKNVSQRIAVEAGVPFSTARRWIKEARDAGHLPPVTKGPST